MLARASSDAGTRLHRSKSTSTVHRPPPALLESLDPDAARKQAVAAATAAFARARIHNADEKKTKCSSEVSRSKSNASRKSITSQGQGSHFPPRESSFRSLNPQISGQHTDTQRPSRTSTMSIERFAPFHSIPSIDGPNSAPRPLSTQPSVAFSEQSRPNTQPKTGRQGATTPITSQQIRKARSMYYASSIQTGSPIARPPAMFLTTPPAASVSPIVNAPPALHSVRSLGLSPLAKPRIPVTIAPDESVDRARDKYLQNFQQRSVKHKPSLFLAPFIKRQDRGKDKSKRLSSGFVSIPANSQRTSDESIVDAAVIDFLPHPDKKDKRSFSGSLKSKIKRVFRRTSKISPPDLPVQQIEASRDYFGAAQIETQNSGDLYGIPSPEQEILQRVRSRNPVLEASGPAYLRSGSRTSSNGSAQSDRSKRSLHSEVHTTNPSTSRVTSWGNSSTDTLAQRAIKRLTVIHESKDSIGSGADHNSSMSTKRKSLPPGALAAFRDPMPMESLIEELPTPVDPKRVFSALMREIETSKSTELKLSPTDRTPGAESDVFESSKTKIMHSNEGGTHPSIGIDFDQGSGNDQRLPSRRPPSAAAQSTQSKTSSMRSLGRAIRSTIRTVTPGEKRFSPCPEQPASVREAVQMPIRRVETPSSTTTLNAKEDVGNTNTDSAYHDLSIDVFSPSAVQIERRIGKAKDRWKTPLNDVEKLQFPRETDRTYSATNSTKDVVSYEKFRRSIDQIDASLNNVPTLPKSPVSPLTQPLMSPLSPSIYSRNTDGISILPNESVMSFNGQDELERHHDEGSAIVLTSQSIRSYVVGTPSPRRQSSSHSSRDWKAWLSHEVSSMGFSSQEDLKINEEYMTPSGNHRIPVTRTSHTKGDSTTVILRMSCDTVTPRAVEDTTANDDPLHTSGFQEAHTVSEEGHDHAMVKSLIFDTPQPQTDMVKAAPPCQKLTIGHAQTYKTSPRPGLILRLSGEQVPSMPSLASSVSQPLEETSNPGRMNERFPFMNSVRRSSNHSAASSRLSKSSPDSVASSLKSTTAISHPKVNLANPGPLINETSQCGSNMLEKSVFQNNSKENITPPSFGGNKGNQRPMVSPLGLAVRPKSLQPLSLAAVNRSTTNVGHYTTDISDIEQSKHGLRPAITPPRTWVRATGRSVSPEKLSRRPKSAFDLHRAKISSQRPALDLRRPTLQYKTSASSLAQNKKPDPNTDARVVDSFLENGERSGSVTPGQRMADRFLRDRKSTGILDSGKYRGGLRLVREDTPAFL